MMPKQMSREAIKHFNAVINHISEVPSGAIKALRNYIFLGNPNPDETVADEYVQFVMDLAAGMPIDESLFGGDDRRNNSRGGKGINASMYTDFRTAC